MENLKSNYLWDMGTQGYKQKGRDGFGYFYDKNVFLRTLAQNNIPLSGVYAFYWD
jgi:hypothetical protein